MGGDVWWFGVNKPGGPDSDYLACFGGTSGATPQVAGLAALLIALNPDLSNGRVRHIIERTCRLDALIHGAVESHPERRIAPGHPPLLWSPRVGCGVIDAKAAFERSSEFESEPLPAVPPEPDPCALDAVIVLEGYLGRGPGSLWRVYGTPVLDRWIEVEETDIVGTEPIQREDGGDARLGARRSADPAHRHERPHGDAISLSAWRRAPGTRTDGNEGSSSRR